MRYESMMIVDSAAARADSDAVCKNIESLIGKCDGSNIEIEKYGERKLAYTVDKRNRGAYYLIHFDMDGGDLPRLHREVKLSDEIFRHIVLLDGDAGLDRRDLSNPRIFNVDSADSKFHFEKYESKNAPAEVKAEVKKPEVKKEEVKKEEVKEEEVKEEVTAAASTENTDSEEGQGAVDKA
jgi:small subunit ribosomal protein S6